MPAKGEQETYPDEFKSSPSVRVRVIVVRKMTSLPFFGARHRVVLLGFFGFFNVYAMRVNLSVAALKMSEEYHW